MIFISALASDIGAAGNCFGGTTVSAVLRFIVVLLVVFMNSCRLLSTGKSPHVSGSSGESRYSLVVCAPGRG
jgi:hypothetical protein